MAQETLYNEDERQYLLMMQENITRMAANSANAKTWLVTIVTAVLAIGCNVEKIHSWLLLALVPVLALWYIDAYYLQLERKFRNREQYYINQKRNEKKSKELDMALYDFRPLYKEQNDEDFGYVETGCQMFNKAVFPLYSIMCLIIIAITGVANGGFKFLYQ